VDSTGRPRHCPDGNMPVAGNHLGEASLRRVFVARQPPRIGAAPESGSGSAYLDSWFETILV